jgi:ATP-dependent helicase/nuclease subunit A
MAAPDLRQLTDCNQAIASNPRVSAWVSANAGTGKTTVLVNRVLRLLLDCDDGNGPYTRPENILCLTYTKAAAGEMENRLFKILSDWAAMPEGALAGALKDLRGQAATAADMTRARQLFAITLDTKGGLKIHTIHAFCERLLHRFPIEADVQADFDVLEEQERRELRDRAIDAVLDRAARMLGTALGDSLMRVIAATGEEGFRGIVDAALARQEELRAMHLLADANNSLGEAERAGIAATLGVSAERSEGDLAGDMASVLSDADLDEALVSIPRDKPTDRALLDALARARAAPSPELRAGAFCEAFLTQTKSLRKTLLTRDVRDSFPKLAQRIAETAARVFELSCEQAVLDVSGCTGALLTLVDEIIGEYERAKAMRAALDYDDLIMRTVRLLRSSQAAAWVLYKLDYGIDHILVDEAQDTSPPQWQVIDALAQEFFAGEGSRDKRRTVFAVGDEKQSIYSFQGADPASFAAQGAAFRRMTEAAGETFERVPLTVSFRSTEPVLKSVDEVFALEGARDGVVWDEPVVHQAVRAGQAGLVELWTPEQPEEHEAVHPMSPHEEVNSGAHARDRLAERIARAIRHWLDEGERLEARDRPMRPGDILVLVRSRDALVPRLIRALKARSIPVAGADRLKLTEQLGVMDLMAFGDFVLMPEDDLTLATALKSPLVGLNDEDLFLLAYKRPGSLWRALRERQDEDPRYAAAVVLLTNWLARTDLQPPYEFFAGILEERAMTLRLALIARLGADAGDAIDEFLQLALDYERIAHPSLQGFLEWVRKAEAEVKRDMEQGRDEVRIMTAHGAKGLEANVVILPDTCRPAMGVGSHAPRLLPIPRASAPPGVPDYLVWVPPGTMELQPIREAKDLLKDAVRREHNRLLYVAMTRARDRLYVAGWKGQDRLPQDCWYALVDAGLKDLAEPETNSLGERVLRYKVKGDGRSRAYDADVDLIPEAKRLPDWARRDVTLERPAALLTPSAIPAGDGEPADQVREQDVVPPLERADPNRFLRGNIIHALLQYLPDVPAELWEKRARVFVAKRGKVLDAKQQENIVSETLAVLRREDFSALFAPGSRAEVSIVARFEGRDGPAIELNGQVDRLVVRDDEVLIVDYKTNRPPPSDPQAVAPLYKRQLAAYRAALERIYPGKSVRAALLWTDGPTLMPIEDSLLDKAASILGSP